jgi:hypothetical protein
MASLSVYLELDNAWPRPLKGSSSTALSLPFELLGHLRGRLPVVGRQCSIDMHGLRPPSDDAHL